MSNAAVLEAPMIDRLMAALRAQGAPIVENLSAGLSVDEMAALVAPLGISLPREAQAWWGYANGVSCDEPLSMNLTPTWAWRPLDEIVGMCRRMREIGNRDLLPDEPKGFADSWLPVVRGEGMLVIDTLRAVLAPVHTVDWHVDDPDAPSTPKLPSLGALIELWTHALEHRGIWFDPAQQRISGDGARLDELGVEWALV